MRSILSIEYEYVRLYVYSIVLQAVIKRHKEKGSPRKTNLKGDSEDRQDSDELYDSLYLKYLTDATRSLLRIVVEELMSEGHLLNLPVRTYSRILAAALYLLKARIPWPMYLLSDA